MDSPRCINCIELGRTGQFYRIAGQQRYKCSGCGVVRAGSEFTQVEYLWKDQPEEWIKFAAEKIRSREGIEKANQIMESEVGKKLLIQRKDTKKVVIVPKAEEPKRVA